MPHRISYTIAGLYLVSFLVGLLFLQLPIFADAAQGRVWIVNNQAPNASDDNAGTQASPLMTINHAAQLAMPGDSVLVHAGVYRERIAPARGGSPDAPITYAAVTGEKVIVTGAQPWSPAWTPIANHPGQFQGSLDPAWFKDITNPYMTRIRLSLHSQKSNRTYPHDKPYDDVSARPAQGPYFLKTLGQVFLDNQPLIQVSTQEELDKQTGSWLVSPEGQAITIHFQDTSPPADGRLQITVRDRIFAPHRRGLGFIHIDGFIFEACANQGPWPQTGAVDTRSGHHWVIQNNIVRFAKTAGIACGSETWLPDDLQDTDPDQRKHIFGNNHLIQNNLVTDNGLVGITGWNVTGCRIINNIAARNNRLHFVARVNAGTEEAAGIKMLGFKNGLIADNLVYDNQSHGIWLDNGWSGTSVLRNVVINNTGSGIFVELGYPPAGQACLVANNIVGQNHQHGIYTHDSSNIIIAHNLVFNNQKTGLWSWIVTDRTTGSNHQPVQASNIQMLGNMIIGNGQGAVSLPLKSDRSVDNLSDYNLTFANGVNIKNSTNATTADPNPDAKVASHAASRFQVNRNAGRIKNTTLIKAFTQALTQANIPHNQWPEMDAWAKQGDVSLKIWQLMTGFDQHNFIPKTAQVKVTRRDNQWLLTLGYLPGELAPVLPNLPAFPDVNEDFQGQPRLDQNVLPGPFQTITPGTNKIILWPRPVASSP